MRLEVGGGKVRGGVLARGDDVVNKIYPRAERGGDVDASEARRGSAKLGASVGDVADSSSPGIERVEQIETSQPRDDGVGGGVTTSVRAALCRQPLKAAAMDPFEVEDVRLTRRSGRESRRAWWSPN